MILLLPKNSDSFQNPKIHVCGESGGIKPGCQGWKPMRSREEKFLEKPGEAGCPRGQAGPGAAA